MSEEALRKLALQVRNWGKWGPDDEIGTLNYITPERIAAACRLVTAGKVFALGIPLSRQGPQSGTRARFNPIHTMFRDGGDAPRDAAGVAEMQGYGGSDDWIVMPLQCVTQWDSLAHIFDSGKMWNGYDARLVTSSGAARNSIDKTTDKIVARRAAGRGAPQGRVASPRGYAITVADLEATARAAGAEVQSGDILLVRTGHMSTYLRQGELGPLRPRRLAGRVRPHDAVAPRARRWRPSPATTTRSRCGPRRSRASGTRSTCARSRTWGCTPGRGSSTWKSLAADCAADGRYAFLLVAPPLPVTGGVGDADQSVRDEVTGAGAALRRVGGRREGAARPRGCGRRWTRRPPCRGRPGTRTRGLGATPWARRPPACPDGRPGPSPRGDRSPGGRGARSARRRSPGARARSARRRTAGAARRGTATTRWRRRDGSGRAAGPARPDARAAAGPRAGAPPPPPRPARRPRPRGSRVRSRAARAAAAAVSLCSTSARDTMPSACRARRWATAASARSAARVSMSSRGRRAARYSRAARAMSARARLEVAGRPVEGPRGDGAGHDGGGGSQRPAARARMSSLYRGRGRGCLHGTSTFARLALTAAARTARGGPAI